MINKDYEIYWNERLFLGCKGLGCADTMSTHISCSSDPKCVNNRCVLIESNGQIVENRKEICSSLSYERCKSNSFSRNWDEVLVVFGISCKESLNLCEVDYE